MDSLCESCHGLVTIDEESRIVRLIHRTAQEFFDRNRAQYIPDMHSQIAQTCIDYLMLDVFAQGHCDFISSRPSDMGMAEGDISESRLLSTRLRQNPLLNYAASYWGIHARGEPEHKIEEHILRFLQASGALDSSFQVSYLGLDYGSAHSAPDRLLKISGSLTLHVAVSFGLEYMVKVLLEKISSSDINGLDQRGKTALHWAARGGSESLTLLLLEAGAEIDTQVKADYSKIEKHLSSGHPQFLDLLINLGLSGSIEKEIVPNEEILENENAVRFDMKKMIEMYLKSGASAAEKKDRATRVLWKASSLGIADLLDVSLANGAEIEAREKEKVSARPDVEDFRVKPGPRRAKHQTALLMAVENGRVGTTLALLSRGASNPSTDRFGKNVLQTAVTSTKVFDERLSKVVDERLSLIRNHSSGSWLSAATAIPENAAPSQLSHSEQDYRAKLSRVIALGLAPTFDILKKPFLEFEITLQKDTEQETIINRLLDSGADIAVRTPQNQMLLHLAIGSVTRLKLLMTRGAGVLEVD